MPGPQLNPFSVVAIVAGVGLALPTLIWLMRRVSLGKRVVVSASAAAVAVGLYWLLEGVWNWEGAEVRVLFVTQFLLIVNLGLQLVEMAVWEGILRRRLAIELPRILIDLLGFAMLAVAVVVAVMQVTDSAVDITDVLVTSTVISAVLGLALQEVLSNVFAGLALHMEGPFQVGDWVSIGGQEGQIAQMGWRTTTVRTRDDHHVTVPNGQVARQEMINYSQPTKLQALNNFVGVSYRDPPARVRDVLKAAAADVSGVVTAPPPIVFVDGYEDFAVRYRVKFWITDYADAPPIRSSVYTNIYYQLKRHGMTIPFPIRDVNLRQAPEVSALAADAAREAVAALRAVPLLAPLNDGQIEDVAAGAHLERYAPSETIVRQGDPGDSLYVLRTGAVAIEVPTAGGLVEVARRGPGEFFGEMSLLIGAARSATVRALAETEVVCVDRAGFRSVLLQDDRVAEALAESLAARQVETDRILADQPAPSPPERSPELLARIRSFFGLELPL